MGFRTITTVTTAATNRLLVARDTVKTVLQITGGDEDAYLDLLVRQASRIAENYCNRVFARETLSDLVLIDRDAYPCQVPGGIDPLQASRWPIRTLTSVTEYAGTANANVLVSGTDYQADLAQGLLTRYAPNGQFPVMWPALPVTLAYVAGWYLPADQGYVAGADASLPPDVEAGVIEIIKAMRAARGRDPAIRSVNIPELMATSYQVAMPTGSGLPASAEALLDNYRVSVIA